MAGAIGLRSTPKGQFGNRLLNYLVIRQLAHELDVGYFSHNPGDRGLIPGIHRLPFPPLRFRRTVYLERSDVEADGFLERARQHIARGEVIVPKPRLLANAYARFDFVDPSRLVRHRFRLCSHHQAVSDGQSPVVLHLRGKDFATWKEGAVLGEQYYRDGLEYWEEQQANDFRVRICTDDLDHPALPGLRDFLRSQGRLMSPEGCTNPFVCDFAAMMAAPVVVSSPSTFAITAGLLGTSRAIHSRSWVDARIADGEVFWQKVRERSIRSYSVEAEV